LTYYDQHMHTYFSPDSRETFENYLEQTDGIIVTTEHFDFRGSRSYGEDMILDYDAYSSKIDELNKQYGERIRKGIEIGYTKESVDEITEYLAGKEFDVKLLSIHQNGVYNFMSAAVDDLDPKAVMKEYYNLCIEAVENTEDINILAHFDFGLRRITADLSDLKEFEPTLKELLNLLIKKDIALELNTRSMYDYNNFDLYNYMIDLYLSLGGNRFSLGSDCHSINQYRYHFDDAVELLKGKGVTDVIQFKDGQGYFEEI